MRNLSLVAGLISLGALLFSFGCGYSAGDDAPGQSLLVANGSVSGRVLDNGLMASARNAAAAPSGQALSGASVWVEELPDRRTVSSSDGHFTISGLPIGNSYHLVVRHDDASRGLFRYRSEAVSISDQQFERQLDLGIQRADQTVTLIVRDSGGTPLNNGTVTFWGETQTVDSQGRVRVQMPMNTSADITAAAPGKAPVVIPVNFETTSQGELGVGLQTTGSDNRPPLVRLSAGSSPNVTRNSELALTATASDPDTDTLAYSWTSTVGTYISSGTTQAGARWRAPDFDTTASVSVEVTDGRGGRAHAVLGVTIGAGGSNQAPVAVILASGTRVEYATALRLTAQAGDPDGDPVTCLWQADRGSLESSSGTTTLWTSPATAGAATISLTAGDSRGASTTTSLVITVLAPNSPPTLTVSATGTSVVPGTDVSLTAQAADIDGDSLSYAWTTSNGTLHSTSGATVVWKAPSAAGVATVTCLAGDTRGGLATATWSFEIAAVPNNAPTVSITSSRQVTAEGVNVSVLSTGRDPDGDPLEYAWTANGGSFASASAAQTSWVPGTGSRSYTLACAVSDGRGKSATSTLQIQVMETVGLSEGEVKHVGLAGGGREVALTTPSGQGRFGLLITSLDRNGAAHSFNVNGGGSVLPAVSGAPALSVKTSQPGFPSGQAAVDAVMRRRAAESPYRLSAKTSIRPSIRASEANLGDIHTFRVYSPAGHQTRSARLAAIGTRCKIFIDQNDAGGYAPGDVTDAMLTEFAAEFDSRIWSFINNNYGSPSNLTGDGKVTILFTPLVNAIGAAGFFDPTDLMPADPDSNDRDIFNMWVYDSHAGYSTAWWKQATTETLVHEFQHLVNTWAHMQNNVGEEAVWLNEGLSVGAEMRYSDSPDSRFAAYEETPELLPLTVWPYDASVANYGCVGLFAHHLYEQLGGDAIRSMVHSTSSGTANIEARSGGKPFNQMFQEWGAAMYRNNKGLSGQATDYRLDVGLDNLKKSQQNFGAAFTASVTGTAWRFIEYLPPSGYAQPFTTITVTDPGNGDIAFSVVRIGN